MVDAGSIKKHRSKARTTAEILRAIMEINEAKITHIIHAANMPYGRLVEHLEKMEESGLVEKVCNENETFYVVTNKGRRYLQEFKRFEEFGDLFGVEI